MKMFAFLFVSFAIYPGHPNGSARIRLDAYAYFPARELRELGCFFRRPRCRHETCLPGEAERRELMAPGPGLRDLVRQEIWREQTLSGSS